MPRPKFVTKRHDECWFIEEIGIEVDHVHLHMIIPAKDAVATVVATLKSVTSRQLKEKFPHFLKKVYWDDGGLWGREYSGDQRGDHPPLCPISGRAGHRTSAA